MRDRTRRFPIVCYDDGSDTATEASAGFFIETYHSGSTWRQNRLGALGSGWEGVGGAGTNQNNKQFCSVRARPAVAGQAKTQLNIGLVILTGKRGNTSKITPPLSISDSSALILLLLIIDDVFALSQFSFNAIIFVIITIT
jgi:hypothetical protein